MLIQTPDDVARLRETILQLAVMGKLVPQDPKDEPASVLLEKIRAQKEKLIANGKIKKQNPLPLIDKGEVSFSLPPGWQWVRLGELVVSIEAGWSPSCERKEAVYPEWGVLKVSAVTWNRFNPRENKKLPEHLSPKKEYEVQPGDFLISRANTAELVARTVLVHATPGHLLMSDKTLRIIFFEYAEQKYINYLHRAEVARTYYASVASGTSSSMRNVSQDQIRKLPVPLPPLAEQKRIVAKVDALMVLCDKLESQITRRTMTGENLLKAAIHSIPQT